jgi:3-carboxy-cis,cis-muconate cycloisomerase
MTVPLIDSLASTEALAEIFSDRSLLQAMLDFEIALARVQARLGIISRSAASAIAATANAGAFDIANLSRDTLRAGTPGIPLVKALIEIVKAKNPAAAGFVHYGATSQDVADTAIILLLKRAQPIIRTDLVRVEQGLQNLAEKHGETVMLGRTLLQPAPPITFGLKAAGWFAAVRRGRQQLEANFAEALTLQFGGAAGTLAALNDKGHIVAEELAEELGVHCPAAPWHTHRDRLAHLICACGVLVGTLGKIARDVSLLMQSEIGEVAEPTSPGRGGSSTMPHKKNPVACAVTLAAANRMPGLVASFLSGMVQEHERGVGGWQSEWPTIADAIQATGSAAAAVAEIAEGLTVHRDKMRRNLDDTRGTIYAEKAMILLTGKIGRDRAHKVVEEAVSESRTRGCSLSELLAGIPEVTKYLSRDVLDRLDQAGDYLGSAEIFRKRQVAADSPARNKSLRKKKRNQNPHTNRKKRG